MADDKTGKPDLKARLGRKRFKTGTSKSLKSLKQMKTQKTDAASEAAPQQPQGAAPAPGPAPAPAPGPEPSAPVGAGPAPAEGAPAPAAEPEVPAIQTGANKKMMWAIAGLVALVSIGVGYACGKSSAQNTMANKAKRDAKKILTDMKRLTKKLQGLGEAFTSPPDTLEGYVKLADLPNVDDPNLVLLSSPYINYIPPASKRRSFLASLLTFYTYIMMVKEDYAAYKKFIDNTLRKQLELVKALDGAKGKTLNEKLTNFLNDLIKKGSEKAAKVQKKGGYLLLINGMEGSVLLVPFDPANARCPKGKRSCDPTERQYVFNNVTYTFAPKPDQPLKEQYVAYPFDKIAPGALQIIARYEVQIPLVLYYNMARTQFKRVKADVEQARRQAGTVMNLLERAAKRKDRGIF